MENLQIDELLIRVDQSVAGCLRLDWLGYGSIANPAERLGPFFEQVLARAQEGGCIVDMHFEALQHFNSATIATLVQYIYAAGRARVPLRIHYDARQRWQALCFEALDHGVHSFGGDRAPSLEFFSTPS